ncbi:MAG: hypothetical protein GY844_03235 [Bradyrhizobium sp.]|nr:hypothetical protein [Bradyrhizobium sp.]
MIERSKRQPHASLICDEPYGKALSVDSEHRKGQDNLSFIHANCCLGFLPMDPVDFHAFAKGQLMVMAILVPAALALFIFFAL